MLAQAVKFKLPESEAKDRFSPGFGANFLGDPARAEGAVGSLRLTTLGRRAVRSNYGALSVVGVCFLRQVHPDPRENLAHSIAL